MPEDVILKQKQKKKDVRWPELIFMRVGHVFESRFSAGMTYAISMIFGILGQEWWNLLLLLTMIIAYVIYFLVEMKTLCRHRDIGIYLKPHFCEKCK